MMNRELRDTKGLLDDLRTIAERGSVPAAEEDLKAKARLLQISAELSRRLIDLEARLRKSPPPGENGSARLTALGRETAQVGYQIHNLLSVLGARLEVSEMCLETGDPEKALRNVRIAKEQFQKVQTLAIGLIDFMGRPTDEYRSDLNEIIRCTVSFVRLLSHYENIEFDLNLGSSLGQLSLDPAKWQQLLLSLFANAADAEGRRRGEGGRIRVSTSNVSSEKRVVLIVEDEGRGIEPDDLARVFDPGFTTKGSGREGLGLFACRQIVQEAGATIAVDSVRGEGTTVTVSIPHDD